MEVRGGTPVGLGWLLQKCRVPLCPSFLVLLLPVRMCWLHCTVVRGDVCCCAAAAAVWKKHMKHVFVMTSAGKPVFSRCESTAPFWSRCAAAHVQWQCAVARLLECG
jgi:hypothetical protein